MESKNLKAETWLSVHYPSRKEWIARYKGIFSRNYSRDMRLCQPDENNVELSRDGLYEILPSALFFTGQELEAKKDDDFKWIDKVLRQRLDRIKTVFLPFDSVYFNHSLDLEKTINDTLYDKTRMLLRDIVGTDFSDNACPYVRAMAPFVLQAAKLRGDYRSLCGLMTCILGYKTEYQMKKNRVRFIVNRLDLDKTGFLAYFDELKPFFAFVEEWFVPFELRCEYKVRDYERGSCFSGSNKLLLDYNANMNHGHRQ